MLNLRCLFDFHDEQITDEQYLYFLLVDLSCLFERQ